MEVASCSRLGKLAVHVQWRSVHCGYVPDQEPAPPPNRKLVIEPQVDSLKAEQMFTEFVEQLLRRCERISLTNEQLYTYPIHNLFNHDHGMW